MKGLVLILLSTTFSFKLKMKGTQLFLGEMAGIPVMSTEPAISVDVEQGGKNPYGFIFKIKNSSRVFDIRGGNPNGDLIFWTYHGGLNQRFSLDLNSEGTGFLLTNGDGCIEVMGNNNLSRNVCNEKNPNQLFTRFDPITNIEQPIQPQDNPMPDTSKKDAPIIIINRKNKRHGHPIGRRIIETTEGGRSRDHDHRHVHHDDDLSEYLELADKLKDVY